ncbi:MICOS complex subunit mic25a isoform X3 [Perca fluviatilis]|uniref:MICOS complex subunit mic25a isoform X3 n=1 Tax=Perca fluviatilis TaxID=8168 RepID=UPI001965549A|nr:MICOS complex subunit mic25a isoform X3 [Perca fluviatilis]
MGSGESTTRKVSFGVDDEDRVRILRGVKLSEDVLQRMRGVANIAPERTSPSTSSPQKETGASRSASSSSRPQQSTQHQAQPSTQSGSSKPASDAKEEQRRYERQQAVLKEELAKVAQREREAAREEMTKAVTQERQHKRQEAKNAKQLPITLSFLPRRQYYQCSASGKLHPESFLELEIGVVRGLEVGSWARGRACFTHQPVPVSRDSPPPSTCRCLISTPTHSRS